MSYLTRQEIYVPVDGSSRIRQGPINMYMFQDRPTGGACEYRQVSSESEYFTKYGQDIHKVPKSGMVRIWESCNMPNQRRTICMREDSRRGRNPGNGMMATITKGFYIIFLRLRV